MKPSRLLAKIVREIYDRCLAEGGDRTTPEEIKAAISAELEAREIDRALIDEIAEDAFEREADRRARQATSAQLNLLTGEDDALDATWRIGGERVRVRAANRDDLLRKLDQQRTNAINVNEAMVRADCEAKALLPYMTDATVTIADAREAWQRDNSGGAS